MKYYYAGAARIAMRRSGHSQDNGLFWLLGDHLGSTAVAAGSAGNQYGEVRYKAWGETRYTSGNTLTTYRFTGQREEQSLGLYFYNARWYDPALGRFVQADTIIPRPGNAQAWDRYAYANNNPLYYTDPSGHVSIPIIFLIAIAALKAFDYSWTAYDAWQSWQVLADPNASQEAKNAAAANLALTAGFEAAEPDELLPISLPLDDLARRRLVTLGKEAGEEAGEQASKSFVSWNFRENLRRLTGSSLDDIVGMDAHHVLPQQFAPDFAEVGININDPVFGTWVDATAHRNWSYAYNQLWEEFLQQKRTKEEILNFARKLAEEYGFDVYFGTP
ncbi:MAG: RHS repeat-associated core domain-containing protein [Desulfobulbaceae bacterium]|nr:RHS repeat-associated core domain-containing protein [Desulfobulbaceae bacterium]